MPAKILLLMLTCRVSVKEVQLSICDQLNLEWLHALIENGQFALDEPQALAESERSEYLRSIVRIINNVQCELPELIEEGKVTNELSDQLTHLKLKLIRKLLERLESSYREDKSDCQSQLHATKYLSDACSLLELCTVEEIEDAGVLAEFRELCLSLIDASFQQVQQSLQEHKRNGDSNNPTMSPCSITSIRSDGSDHLTDIQWVIEMLMLDTKREQIRSQLIDANMATAQLGMDEIQRKEQPASASQLEMIGNCLLNAKCLSKAATIQKYWH